MECNLSRNFSIDVMIESISFSITDKFHTQNLSNQKQPLQTLHISSTAFPPTAPLSFCLLELPLRPEDAFQDLIGLYYKDLARKVWNMSSFDLSEPTNQRLPAFPRPEMSLVLIQTQKYYPSIRNFAQLPLEDHQDLQISLQEHIRAQVIGSAVTIKRKKGGCTCKKTKCLKMYCECFASGKMCTDDCNCKGCSNCQQHKDSITRAKQLLKAKEATRSSEEKGCNCRKSHCQKKYCECFNLGIPCGKDCNCIGCQNNECSHGKGASESRQTMMMRVAQSFMS